MMMIRPIALLLCAAALVACGDNAVQDITGPLASSRIKFYNFAVGSPGVNFYANDTKMTVISTAACTPANDPVCLTTGLESTTGINYGGAAPVAGDLYAGIAPGQYMLTGRIAAATDKNLPITNLTAMIEDGKRYSFYQSGIYNTATKTADAFIIEDPLPATIDYSVANVRFVHAISNANPMTLYATSTTTGEVYPIGGAVTYKSAGAFTAIPFGAYNLSTRYTGGSTNVLTRTSVTFSAGRVYTVSARGNITVASTQLLDNTTNR